MAAYHVMTTARPASMVRGWVTQTPDLPASARCATLASTTLTGRGTSKETRRSDAFVEERTRVSAAHIPVAPSSWLMVTSSMSAFVGSNIHTVPAASYWEVREKLAFKLS